MAIPCREAVHCHPSSLFSSSSSLLSHSVSRSSSTSVSTPILSLTSAFCWLPSTAAAIQLFTSWVGTTKSRISENLSKWLSRGSLKAGQIPGWWLRPLCQELPTAPPWAGLPLCLVPAPMGAGPAIDGCLTHGSQLSPVRFPGKQGWFSSQMSFNLF